MTELRRNEFIDLMQMNELIYEEHEHHVFADIPFLGTVTFYPKKNSLNIHKGNKWETGNGFEFVKNAIKEKSPIWLKAIQEIELLRDLTSDDDLKTAYLECIEIIEKTLKK